MMYSFTEKKVVMNRKLWLFYQHTAVYWWYITSWKQLLCHSANLYQDPLPYEIKFVIKRFAQRLTIRLTIQIIASISNLTGHSTAVLSYVMTPFRCQSNWPILNKIFYIGKMFFHCVCSHLYLYTYISSDLRICPCLIFYLPHFMSQTIVLSFAIDIILFFLSHFYSRLSLFHFYPLKKIIKIMLIWYYTNHQWHIKFLVDYYGQHFTQGVEKLLVFWPQCQNIMGEKCHLIRWRIHPA